MCHVCAVWGQNIHLNYICYHRLLKRNGNRKLSSTSKQRREHWQMCLNSLGRQVGHPCIKGCLLMGNSDCPKMSIVDIDIPCTQAHRQACICIHLTYIHIHTHKRKGNCCSHYEDRNSRCLFTAQTPLILPHPSICQASHTRRAAKQSAILWLSLSTLTW